MSEARIDLKNVCVKFRRYELRSHGLKEAVLRFVTPPAWEKEGKFKQYFFWGLKDINLSLREGDRLGIIGHNGAGKSTLLKVLSRVYKPTSGELSIQGRVAPLIEIGAGFAPDLSGRENVFLNGTILGIKTRALTERMDSIVQFSELEGFIDTPVKYYSTGMYLRLAFTLATEVIPDILILDELYAGGDATFVEKGNRRLDHFVHSSKILILVAHQMEYIQRFCNRVIVMEKGQIIGDGNAQDMIARYLAHMKGETGVFDVKETCP